MKLEIVVVSRQVIWEEMMVDIVTMNSRRNIVNFVSVCNLLRQSHTPIIWKLYNECLMGGQLSNNGLNRIIHRMVLHWFLPVKVLKLTSKHPFGLQAIPSILMSHLFTLLLGNFMGWCNFIACILDFINITWFYDSLLW